MNRLEFSYQFDLLYNNISSNQAPGVDEYEKSVFLTKAQDEILKSYFDPRLNKPMEGFDGAERRQIDFSNVLCTYSTIPSDETDNLDIINRSGYYRFELPDNILMMVNEFVVVNRRNTKTVLSVVPITYAEWNSMMKKPYKRPPHTQAWRVLTGGKYALVITGPNDKIEESEEAYSLRFIRKPYPIILDDFTSEGITIGGYPDSLDGDNVCELDPILHEEILQRAVEMAKATYQGDINTVVQLGQVSQTPIGAVQQQSQRQQ